MCEEKKSECVKRGRECEKREINSMKIESGCAKRKKRECIKTGRECGKSKRNSANIESRCAKRNESA